MALDQQLKSEITGIPADAFQKTEAKTSAGEPVSAPECAKPEPPKPESRPTPAPVEVRPGEAPAAADPMPLLRSIESQFRSMNENMKNLERLVSDSKNPDFRSVFTKIDSARMSLEKLISGAPTSAEENNAQLMAMLKTLLEKQEKNDRQLVQSLRDNANFQVQVRQGMQHDLDKLKEQVAGEHFNPILKEIATVFVDYQSLLDDETISDRSRKNLQSLFEELEDLLSEYGAEVWHSEVGSARPNRICKIVKKIPTGSKEQHNTVAVSRKPGVIRDRAVLSPEYVDIYIYDETLAEKALAEEAVQENETPASEEICRQTADASTDTTNEELLGGNEL